MYHFSKWYLVPLFCLPYTEAALYDDVSELSTTVFDFIIIGGLLAQTPSPSLISC